MKTGQKYLMFMLAFLSTAPFTFADKTELESLPPVVIQTYPLSGAKDVDPETRKIKVLFSKPMMKKSWSFVMADKESFPQLDGDPLYEKDGKTCILKVKLQPDKTYVIWLNSAKFQNFKDLNGTPAVPYLLAFKTAGNKFTEKKSAAVKASENWLEMLENGSFSDSWDKAAPFFKEKVKEQQWIDQMGKIKNQLGALESRKLLGVKFFKTLPGAPKGEYFVIQFKTSFENKPSAVETITPMLGKDGKWKVSGYFIK